MALGRLSLTARLDAAVGRLHEIGLARLVTPGAEPVTAADLEVARQVLAGPARAIDDVIRSLEDIAADALATADGRWRRHYERAMAREEHAQRLLPSLRGQGHEVLSAVRALAYARLTLPPVPGPDAGTGDVVAAAEALNAMAEATDRLDAAVSETALGRVFTVLGPDHGLGLGQATRVMALADWLSLATSPDWTDAQRFGWLAQVVGVRNREDAARPNFGSRDQRPVARQLAGLLGLATEVFDDPFADPPGLDDVIDLRRLADIIRTAPVAEGGVRGRDISLADLRDEFRRLGELAATVVVTPRDLRDLARLGRLAKEAKGRVGRQVTRADLREQAATARRVERAQRYLDAEPGTDLTDEERSG